MSGFDNRNLTVVSNATGSGGTYTMTENDSVIIIDNTAGASTVQLLAGSTDHKGRTVIVTKNNGSANAVTVNVAGGGTINGAASISLASGAYHGAVLVCDGTNWVQAAQF